MFNKTKTIFLISLIALSLTVSGCSLFGGKKKGSSGEDDSSLSESDLNGRSGNIASAEGEGLFRDVHFDYNSSQLTYEAQQDIEYNVQVLKDNPNMKVQLEGHCDERGTEDYNMALGQRRADSVAAILVSLGISDSTLSTVSYGENVPLVSGSSEAAWAKNRRVHFSASR